MFKQIGRIGRSLPNFKKFNAHNLGNPNFNRFFFTEQINKSSLTKDLFEMNLSFKKAPEKISYVN